MNLPEHQKQQQVLEAISFYRGLILDAVENELSETQAWPSTRSRLLRLLGDRGLEGKVREILGVPTSPHSGPLAY
ncbi:MAG: hypothetical protein JNM39_16360 [Bdellovibrionaceae bacterium]|nr:hypothetical protein [Pseudobdellovibrionaceae bacterium]